MNKPRELPDRCTRVIDEQWYCDSPMRLIVESDVVVERCANFGHIRTIHNVLPEQTAWSWHWGKE